jgi:hypothetical protein
MSDALSRNDKSDFAFLRSYCLAHGLRKFFDLDKKIKEASDFVVDKIAIAYKNEKYCKEINITRTIVNNAGTSLNSGLKTSLTIKKLSQIQFFKERSITC